MRKTKQEMINKDFIDCLLITHENLSDGFDPISSRDVSSLHGAGGGAVLVSDVEATVPPFDHRDWAAKVCSTALVLGILREGRE